MLKAQFPGMEHLPREIFREFRAVNFIAENRMTEMMKVHTDLMRPSAVQFAFDQTDLIGRTHDAILRLRGATALGPDRHSLSMHRVTSDFFFNGPCAFPQLSGDEREINLFYAAPCKLRRQSAVRFIGFCDDQTTARLFIQSMDNSRPFFSADSGKLRKVMQQRIDQCVLAMASARMNDQPRWLVDYDQVFIFIKNIEGNRFRLIVDLFQRRLVHFNAITGAHKIARPGSGAI